MPLMVSLSRNSDEDQDRVQGYSQSDTQTRRGVLHIQDRGRVDWDADAGSFILLSHLTLIAFWPTFRNA